MAGVDGALPSPSPVRPDILKAVQKPIPVKDGFVLDANGNADLGHFQSAAGEWVGEAHIQDGPLRYPVGDERFGLNHITPDKLQRIQKLGYDGPDSFADDVAKNYNEIWQQDGSTNLLYVKRNGSNKLAVVEARIDTDGYHSIVSVFDVKDTYLTPAKGKRLIWRRRTALHPDQVPSGNPLHSADSVQNPESTKLALGGQDQPTPMVAPLAEPATPIQTKTTPEQQALINEGKAVTPEMTQPDAGLTEQKLNPALNLENQSRSTASWRKPQGCLIFAIH